MCVCVRERECVRARVYVWSVKKIITIKTIYMKTYINSE